MTYDNVYLKLPGDPQYWRVKDGVRKAVPDQKTLHIWGLRPVITVSTKELESYPIEGEEEVVLESPVEVELPDVVEEEPFE
jgi:hypothetical protein